MTNKLLSLQDAELFSQEAITPYEKVCARNLVAAMRENQRLRELVIKSGEGLADLARGVRSLSCVMREFIEPNKESDNG